MAENLVGDNNKRNVEDKCYGTVWKSCKVCDDKGNTAYTARCKVLWHNKAVDARGIQDTACKVVGKVSHKGFKGIFWLHTVKDLSVKYGCNSNVILTSAPNFV